MVAAAAGALDVWGPYAPRGDADESAVPGPDPVRSMQVAEIYRAVGRVPPLVPPSDMEIPGFGGFSLLDANQLLERGVLPPGGDLRYALASYLLSRFAVLRWGISANVTPPPAAVELGTPADPLFSNYTFEGGSETVESGGRSSSTEPEPGTSYSVEAGPDGSVKAEYSAHATVRGGDTTINGSWTFEAVGMGESRGFGSIGIDSSVLLWPDGPHLKLSGYANVVGPDAFSIALGKTSYAIGAEGRTADGNTVGVSAAISESGDLRSVSVGGVVNIPDVTSVKVRIDLSSSGGEFSTDPVPGLSISEGTSGTFRLNLEVVQFYTWLRKITGGK